MNATLPDSVPRPLRAQQRLYFRDELRAARAAALKDAEGFYEIALCLERLGLYLSGPANGLAGLQAAIRSIALDSPLAQDIPADHHTLHSGFDQLYEYVRRGRNDAAHQGAYARQVTQHAVQLSLILEDALMNGASKAGDFMVREPVCAELWQPVSFIRHKMLANSFSFLPVRDAEDSWKLISDRALAVYLRGAEGNNERRRRLAKPLDEALADGDVMLDDVETVLPDTDIQKVAAAVTDRPVLVVDDRQYLQGIITAFDLL